MAPSLPKQLGDTAIIKQMTPSGTSISATIAKLCSSSSRLSSLIVKNVGIVKLLLFAGIVTLIGVPLKSGTGGSEGKTASLLAEKNRDISPSLLCEASICLQ